MSLNEAVQIAIVASIDSVRLHFSFHFCINVQERETLKSKLIFSDEYTFHVSGNVNHHYLCIWGNENLHSVVEHYQDFPKVNMFCTMSSSRVYGPIFFTENTITSVVYLDMLQLWLMPQLEEHEDDFIFQKGGAPPHFMCDVHDYLNTHTYLIDGLGELPKITYLFCSGLHNNRI